MAKERDPYKMEAHNFTMAVGRTAYRGCWNCGLIAMKNEFSQWAIRMGCNHKDHPSYESKRGLTNPFE